MFSIKYLARKSQKIKKSQFSFFNYKTLSTEEKVYEVRRKQFIFTCFAGFLVELL